MVIAWLPPTTEAVGRFVERTSDPSSFRSSMTSDVLMLVAEFTLSTLNDVMQVPPPSQVRPPPSEHIVPCARLPGSTVPPRHDGVAHAVGAGTSASKATGLLLPEPSHWFWLQSGMALCTVSTVPAAAREISQKPAVQTFVAQVVSAPPGHVMAVMHWTHAPAPSHCVALRAPVQAVPCAAGGFVGTPAVHTLCRHMLLVGGLSLSSLATTTPPVASQTFCLQSPGICVGTTVPWLAKVTVQVPLLQTGVWHSLAGAPQSASTLHPTHTPEALHIWAAPQGVPSGRIGFCGVPFEQVSLVHMLPSTSTSVSSLIDPVAPLMQTAVLQLPVV